MAVDQKANDNTEEDVVEEGRGPWMSAARKKGKQPVRQINSGIKQGTFPVQQGPTSTRNGRRSDDINKLGVCGAGVCQHRNSQWSLKWLGKDRLNIVNNSSRAKQWAQAHYQPGKTCAFRELDPKRNQWPKRGKYQNRTQTLPLFPCAY